METLPQAAKSNMKKAFEKWNSISLVLRILCGLITGIILGLTIPKATVIILFGDLFVGALKAIAPLLVFFLVMSALAHMGEGQKTNMGFIVMLYMLGNLFSALVSVIACRLFPITLTLAEAAGGDMAPPSGVGEVLKNLLLNVVANPVGSIVDGNYIGILAWACIFGIALKGASSATKKMLDDFSEAISTGVKWVISFADACSCGDGTIYRASNFVLTGIKENLNLAELPDGTRVHKMTLASNPTSPRKELGGLTFFDVTGGTYNFKKYLDYVGATPIPGFQLRYIYFIDKSKRKDLTVPEIPFSKIDELGAGMYKGEKITFAERHSKVTPEE